MLIFLSLLLRVHAINRGYVSPSQDAAALRELLLLLLLQLL